MSSWVWCYCSCIFIITITVITTATFWQDTLPLKRLLVMTPANLTIQNSPVDKLLCFVHSFLSHWTNFMEGCLRLQWRIWIHKWSLSKALLKLCNSTRLRNARRLFQLKKKRIISVKISFYRCFYITRDHNRQKYKHASIISLTSPSRQTHFCFETKISSELHVNMKIHFLTDKHKKFFSLLVAILCILGETTCSTLCQSK